MDSVSPLPEEVAAEDSTFALPLPAEQEPGTIMIAAFEGWNDAGEAASDAIKVLAKLWDARKVQMIEPDDYYDFQFTRPMVRTNSRGQRRITWPGTRLLKAKVERNDGSTVTVILVHGVEPSYRWRAFTAELLVHAEQQGVQRIILLGSLLADVPHTRPLPVSLSSDDESMREVLGAETSTYQGPLGIVGVLAELARLAGIPSVSLWAAVPHYVGQSPSPKAELALLHRLEDVLQLSLDPGELGEEAEAWERGVDELAADDPEIASYVSQLEQATDTAELPEASGESIAREFERYLKRRDKGNTAGEG